MTVETEPEIEIDEWRYDRSAYRYSRVNGLYVTARPQEIGYVVKLEFKWSDAKDNAPPGRVYAVFTLREFCESESEFDEAATKIYKKLHAMRLALESFKDTE
mgnify:CR=1 FL=1